MEEWMLKYMFVSEYVIIESIWVEKNIHFDCAVLKWLQNQRAIGGKSKETNVYLLLSKLKKSITSFNEDTIPLFD